MIVLEDITLRVAGRTLIKHVNVTLPAGHHYGLVGRNGTGKSTLFKAILGDLHPDEGHIILNKKFKIGHVAQEVPRGTITPLEIVLAADKERTQLLEECNDCKDPMRFSEIQERLLVIDAFSAESRAASVLYGLGFDSIAQNSPISQFSGGWRMRVALAAILFSAPDLLLLDEPTNYLDLEATIWLEKYLKSYPHSFIVISHERQLLNAVCDRILLLQNENITCYSGNYDTFLKTWSSQQENLIAQHTKQEASRKHMQSFVDRFKAKATKARQAQSRMKAIEKLEKLPDIYKEPSVRFQLPSPEELPPPILVLDGVDIGYVPSQPILKEVSLRLDGDDRIGILGENGNGKSTLAKLIAGRMSPQQGDVTRSKKLRIGYFAQHQIDEFNPDQSAFEHLGHILKTKSPTEIRTYLGCFGLSGDKADTAVAKLSGGEKARLNIALICVNKPHLLIMDEPTNHLDMASREALIEALNIYQGAVLVIAHDRAFLEATVDSLLIVANQKVTVFDGDLEDYKQLILKKKNQKTPKEPVQKKEKISKPLNETLLKKEEEKAAKALELCQKEVSVLQAELANPEAYQANQHTQLINRLNMAETSLHKAEEVWLKALEELENYSKD